MEIMLKRGNPAWTVLLAELQKLARYNDRREGLEVSYALEV